MENGLTEMIYMKFDTNEMEHEFCTQKCDGFILVNAREIGIEVAHQLMDCDAIYQSDIYEQITEYLVDIMSEAQTVACEVLEENNKIIEY